MIFDKANLFGKTDAQYEFIKKAKENGIENVVANYVKCSDEEARQLATVLSTRPEFRDANPLGIAGNTLSSLRAEILEVMYLNGARLNEFIPIVNAIAPAGAETYDYDVIDTFGRAQYLSNDGREAERSNISRSRISFPLKSLGIDGEITDQDFAAAAFSGRPLQPLLLRANTESVLSTMVDTLIKGNKTLGWTGLINSGDVPVSTTSITGNWASSATSEQITNDFTAILSEMVNDTAEAILRIDGTAGVQKGTLCIALPLDVFAKWSKRTYGTAGEYTVPSILDEFAARNLFTLKTGMALRFILLRELKGAGEGGKDRAIFYYYSPQVVHLGVVQMPTLTRIIQKERSIVMPFDARHGRVAWLHPGFCRYVDYTG